MSACSVYMQSAYTASEGTMTDNNASPFNLRDICSGLYDVVDWGEVYQDRDSLMECALGEGPALPFVEVALELCLNP